MSPEQKEFLAKRFKEFYVPGLNQLKSKLMAIDGKMMVPQPEHKADVHRLLNYGQIFPTTKLTCKRGLPNRCHSNAARLWCQTNNTQLVSGYALATDELWRQHSWLWDPKKQRIIETTHQFLQYFGATLEQHELLKFIMANCPEMANQPTAKLTKNVNQWVATNRQAQETLANTKTCPQKS
jgi:hypothetical protein